MNGKHWALVGGFVSALAVQMLSIGHWHEVTHPAFVAGVLAQVGTFITAMFTDRPAPRGPEGDR